MSNSNGLHHHQNGGSDEDDETFDSADHDAYYHPIAPSSDADDEDESDDKASASSDDAAGGSHVAERIRPNGVFSHHAENGIAALDLDAGVAGPNVIAVEEDEEEAERARERDASVVRAFREDASRRSAPLTPENAARVVEAMRGVAFRGAPPDWADRVPEDQWVDRLRSLRDEPGTRG